MVSNSRIRLVTFSLSISKLSISESCVFQNHFKEIQLSISKLSISKLSISESIKQHEGFYQIIVFLQNLKAKEYLAYPLLLPRSYSPLPEVEIFDAENTVVADCQVAFHMLLIPSIMLFKLAESVSDGAFE